MVRLRDFLDRFRPAAAPGAPSRRGVPVDRAAEREAELAPVFTLLAETEGEADRIRQRASDEAERLRREARVRAEAVAARAEILVEAARAESAARASAAAGEQREWALRAAEEVAEQVRVRAAERLPECVAHAIRLARESLDGLPVVAEAKR